VRVGFAASVMLAFQLAMLAKEILHADLQFR